MGLIIHIPHASTNIPSYEGYVVSKERVKEEALELGDLYTDEIFTPGNLEDCAIVKAEFSRVFCDVERFLDEKKEQMNKYGMGIAYEKDSYAEPFRKVSERLKQQIIDEYYTPHHEKVSEFVAEHLDRFGEALIIDCHSFPDLPKYYMDYGKHKAPDICLSNCDYGFSIRYMLAAFDYFKSLGYSVSLHTPFKGAFIPNKYFRETPKVMSVLIEINRRIYMDERTFKKDTSSVKRLNKEITGLYKHLMDLQEVWAKELESPKQKRLNEITSVFSELPLKIPTNQLNWKQRELREDFPRAFEPWTEFEDELMEEAITLGASFIDLAFILLRPEEEIEKEIRNA